MRLKVYSVGGEDEEVEEDEEVNEGEEEEEEEAKEEKGMKSTGATLWRWGEFDMIGTR